MSWRERAKSLWQRRWLRLLVEGLIVIVIVSAVSLWQARNTARGPAPTFSLRTLTGETVSLEDLRGQPALVVFWAPWCRVCALNADNVSRVERWLGERVRVVTIASEYEAVQQVKDGVARDALGGTVLLGGSQTARRYGVAGFPTFFILDSRGEVSSAVVGYTSTIGLLARLWWAS